MNNKERKRLALFVAPYLFVAVGMIALLVAVIVHLPTTDHVIIVALPILLIAVGFFLAIGMTMLAADILHLRMYLEEEL